MFHVSCRLLDHSLRVSPPRNNPPTSRPREDLLPLQYDENNASWKVYAMGAEAA